MHQGRQVWGEKKLYTQTMSDIDKKLKTLISKMIYSDWYKGRPDTGAAAMKRFFVENGWTPPPEPPAQPQEGLSGPPPGAR